LLSRCVRMYTWLPLHDALLTPSPIKRISNNLNNKHIQHTSKLFCIVIYAKNVNLSSSWGRV